MSWITSSVGPHIVLNLRPYKIAKEMWDYLNTVYQSENSANKFQLEFDIQEYKQGTQSIQDYCSGQTSLWTEYTDLIYSTISSSSLPGFQKVYRTTSRDQFLMKLRDEYETARSNLMSKYPILSLDICLGELLRDKQ